MLAKWLVINVSNRSGYLKVPYFSYFQVHTDILYIEHIIFLILSIAAAPQFNLHLNAKFKCLSL